MNRETVSHAMPSGQSVKTYLPSSVTDHPETPDLGGYPKNVGVSGQDGFILNDSGARTWIGGRGLRERDRSGWQLLVSGPPVTH